MSALVRGIGILLLGGCASRPAPPLLRDDFAAVAVVDASSLATDGASPRDGGGDRGLEDASADEGALGAPLVQIADEPIYAPGARRHAGSAVADSDDDATIARWNAGGSSVVEEAPSVSPSVKAAHPAPRIKVDVVSVRGRMDEAELLRQARTKGYWPLRLCYEAGLRRMQNLSGTARVRLTLDKRGRPRQTKRVRAELADDQVLACIVEAIGALSLPAPLRGTPEIVLEVALYPGDEPVYVRSGGAARVATDGESLTRALRDTWPALRACYAQGIARDAELWGRIAVRMRVATRGAVVEATEIESHFPERGVTSCVCRVLGQLDGLPVRDGTSIVYPVRFGAPRRDGGT